MSWAGQSAHVNGSDQSIVYLDPYQTHSELFLPIRCVPCATSAAFDELTPFGALEQVAALFRKADISPRCRSSRVNGNAGRGRSFPSGKAARSDGHSWSLQHGFRFPESCSSFTFSSAWRRSKSCRSASIKRRHSGRVRFSSKQTLMLAASQKDCVHVPHVKSLQP